MNDLFYNITQFASETFPDATAQHHYKKLSQEALEAMAKPYDKSEAADCLIALFAAIDKSGFTIQDIQAAAAEKMIINRQRSWTRHPDGTYQHKK